ncbi:MAG: hypothetical protein GVY09_02955 [Gammaproteobacteria bacterium]|jgi:hypothetical protein|nr:hypothetical protein [Gammaproteobacteria bacterium]
MSAPAYMQRVNAAAVRVHGEPVILIDASEIQAIVEIENEAGIGMGLTLDDALSDHGSRLALLVPAAIAAANSAALAEGQSITVRAASYLVAEPPEQDGFGFVRVPLVPV